MKRTALTRRTWLRSGKPLARRTKLRAVNRVRLAKRRAEHFGRQAQLCRELQCAVPFCREVGEPHHEPPRSVGGRDRDCVPLCRFHHHERHHYGRITFEVMRHIDLTHAIQVMRGLVSLDNRGSQDSRRE
jgi:hypothetical protein